MLRDGPTDAAKKAKWVSAIIDEIPKDSWDNDLEYNVNGGSFELRSSGLDQQMNTDEGYRLQMLVEPRLLFKPHPRFDR